MRLAFFGGVRREQRAARRFSELPLGCYCNFVINRVKRCSQKTFRASAQETEQPTILNSGKRERPAIADMLPNHTQNAAFRKPLGSQENKSLLVFLPFKQRSFCDEPWTERGHQPEVSALGFEASLNLSKHRQYCHAAHIALVVQNI